MSSQFTDGKGRAWLIEITIGKINRVSRLTGIHLEQPVPLSEQASEQEQLPLLAKLSLDLPLFCGVLFALIQDQAEKQGVSEEDFLDAMTGEACQRAQDSFWEEYADFFHQMPRLPFAQVARQAIDLSQDAVEQTAETAKTTLQSQKQAMRQILREAAEDSRSTSGNLSTDQLEPSVSIPAA